LAALQAMEKLFLSAKENKLAKHYALLNKKLSVNIKSLFLDTDKKNIFPGIDEKNQPITAMPQGAIFDTPLQYAWAIMTDFLPELHKDFAYKLLSICERDICASTPSPSMIFLVFEALKKLGYHHKVIDTIDRWWGEMNIDRNINCTIENWWINPNKGGSRCHAWSAHPIVHFINIILGIYQADIAWKKIRFSPVFTHTNKAEGKVPTSYGFIKSSWKKKDGLIKISLEVPEGIDCKVDIAGKIRENKKGPFKKEYNLKYKNENKGK
jgi:hypothetical protein